MGLWDGEVTTCQRVLYFTLTRLKADSTQPVVKEGPIKIHRAIDLSPVPLNPLLLAHKQDIEKNYRFSYGIFLETFS